MKNEENGIVFQFSRVFSQKIWKKLFSVTGKSLLEALILASTNQGQLKLSCPWTNPQYDEGLFIDLLVQYMKTTSSEPAVYVICFECQNKKTIYVHNMY